MKFLYILLLFLYSLNADVKINQVGTFNGEFSKLILNSDYIYSTDNFGNFNIINIALTNDIFITSTIKNLNITNFFSDSNYSYLISTNSVIKIVDEKDKHNPNIVGDYYIESLKEMIVEDDFIYVIDNYANLSIFDSSNKSNLIQISKLGLYKPNSIYLDKNYIYVANDSKGVLIIDISNKANPLVIKTIESSKVLKLFVKDNYLYLLDERDGVKIFDISNLEDIKLLSTIEIINLSKFIIQDSFLYLYSLSNTLTIYDISDKKNPILIDSLEFKDKSLIGISDSYLYFNSINEILIFELQNLKAVDSVSNIETNSTTQTINQVENNSNNSPSTSQSGVSYITNIYVNPTITITNDSNSSQNISISIDVDSTLSDEFIFLKIEKGWNLIAIPVDKSIYDMDKYGANANDIDIKILNFAETFWIYVNEEWYEKFDFIYPKQGIWLKSNEYKILPFKGRSYLPDFELITNKWQLFGTGQKIENLKEQKSLDSIWKFVNGNWIKDPNIINQGEGFWAKK